MSACVYLFIGNSYEAMHVTKSKRLETNRFYLEIHS